MPASPVPIRDMSGEVKELAAAAPRSRSWLFYLSVANSFLLILLAITMVVSSVLLSRAISQQTKNITSARSEIVALRHLIGSQTAEDVIFLKTVILRPKIDPKLAREIASSLHKYSLRFKRDPDLILAMIEIEANFKPDAVSAMGAVGLMQVMPQWVEQLGIACDLKDVDCNIKYGMQIFAFYDQMYKHTETALMAYNRGPGAVDWDLMRGKDPARNGYARRIMEVYERLKEMSVGHQ